MVVMRVVVIVVVVVVVVWCCSFTTATYGYSDNNRTNSDNRGRETEVTVEADRREDTVVLDEGNTCREGEEGCVCYYEEYYEDEEEEEEEEKYKLRGTNVNRLDKDEEKDDKDGRGKRIGRKGVDGGKMDVEGIMTEDRMDRDGKKVKENGKTDGGTTDGGTTDEGTTDGDGKSRQKRFLFFGPDQRLAFPPGAVLIVTPTLSLPLRRYPPEVFSSAFRNATSGSMTVSIPLSVKFDDLGLTSDLNRFGILSLFKKRKRRRRRWAARGRYYEDEVDRNAVVAGGARPAMYLALEDILKQVGIPGRDCLLRAMCEMFQAPLNNHGFFGEMLDLFLSPSKSPSHEKPHLEAYLQAEREGRTTGDCSAYHAACPKPLFTDPGPPLEGEFEEDEEDTEERRDTCELPGSRY